MSVICANPFHQELHRVLVALDSLHEPTTIEQKQSGDGMSLVAFTGLRGEVFDLKISNKVSRSTHIDYSIKHVCRPSPATQQQCYECGVCAIASASRRAARLYLEPADTQLHVGRTEHAPLPEVPAYDRCRRRPHGRAARCNPGGCIGGDCLPSCHPYCDRRRRGPPAMGFRVAAPLCREIPPGIPAYVDNAHARLCRLAGQQPS
jgi:hypothetical protein